MIRYWNETGVRNPRFLSVAAVYAKMHSFKHADTIHDMLQSNCVMVSCSVMRRTHYIRFWSIYLTRGRMSSTTWLALPNRDCKR